jgi:general secretion pathway protein A
MYMDYIEFFHLVEEPYSYLVPNPRFFYYSTHHLIAKTILSDAVRKKNAHLYLTGPVGSGKTTLLQVIKYEFEADQNNVVFLTHAPRYLRSSHSYLKRLCHEMDITTARSYNDTLENFEAQIGDWVRMGKTPVLLVDEAHKLTKPALDFFHHTMNFVTTNRILFVLVLAGQEELVPKIKKYDELRSRLQAVTLSSLPSNDAQELTKHRWKIASKDEHNPFPFDDDALAVIYKIAKGLPRDICSIAGRSLQFAYGAGVRNIGEEIAEAAAQSLNFTV